VPEALAVAHRPRLKFHAKVAHIDPANRRLQLENGDAISFSAIIATLPLPKLLSLCQLHFSPVLFSHANIINIRVGFSGRIKRPEHWYYVPSRDVPFYRIGIPSNVNSNVCPPGCAVLTIALVRTRNDLISLCRIFILFGLTLFFLALIGAGSHPEFNGLGWGPYGGPLTFYRVEFIALSAALFLAAQGERAILTTTPILLFGTFASLSKAALGGALVILLYVSFQLAVIRRSFAMLVVGFAAVFAFFLAINSPAFMARLKAGFGQHQQSFLSSTPDQSVAYRELPRSDATVGAGSDASEPPRIASSQAPTEQPSNWITLYDGSHRIQMALKAMELFRTSPIMGTGFGSYRIVLKNLYGPDPIIAHYPHNVSLEILSMTGLVGFIPFVVCILLVLVVLQRCILEQPDVIYLAAGALFVLITSHAAGDFYDLRMFWLISIVAAGGINASATNHDIGRIA
jgi:O-Antigen ligase